MSSSYGEGNSVVDEIERTEDRYFPLRPRPHRFFKFHLKREVRVETEVLSCLYFFLGSASGGRGHQDVWGTLVGSG